MDDAIGDWRNTYLNIINLFICLLIIIYSVSIKYILPCQSV